MFLPLGASSVAKFPILGTTDIWSPQLCYGCSPVHPYYSLRQCWSLSLRCQQLSLVVTTKMSPDIVKYPMGSKTEGVKFPFPAWESLALQKSLEWEKMKRTKGKKQGSVQSKPQTAWPDLHFLSSTGLTSVLALWTKLGLTGRHLTRSQAWEVSIRPQGLCC